MLPLKKRWDKNVLNFKKRINNLLRIALPWNLSHYFTAQGFDPLYSALLEHAPKFIQFYAWDHVKLSQQMKQPNTRHQLKHFIQPASFSPDTECHPNNQILTQLLWGDIEFLHTIPYASLTRPFIFYCKNVSSSIFLNENPLSRQRYTQLFSNPLCLGIFSHQPEVLQKIQNYFDHPVIHQKLSLSRVGIGASHLATYHIIESSNNEVPHFLFLTRENNSRDFFQRYGALVLQFWQSFLAIKKTGTLILYAKKPSDEEFLSHGCDLDFIKKQSHLSIIWNEKNRDEERSLLIKKSHFLLLPNLADDPFWIMLGAHYGVLPIIIKTPETFSWFDLTYSIQVRAIKNVRSCTEITQWASQITALLENSLYHQHLRKELIKYASIHFSGAAFSTFFWQEIVMRYQKIHHRVQHKPSPLMKTLATCTIPSDCFMPIFQSPSKPIQRIDSGQYLIYEHAGTWIQTSHRGDLNEADWSPISHFIDERAPLLHFSKKLQHLPHRYMTIPPHYKTIQRTIIKWLSELLMPYPLLHSWAINIRQLLKNRPRGLKNAE